MIFKSTRLLGLCAALGLGLACSAIAVEPAVAAKKLCKGDGDHFHYGSGQPQKTKHLAMKDAVAYWRGFTEFEYGDAWDHFTLASRKSFKCEKLGPRKWQCSVEAVPCRRG